MAKPASDTPLAVLRMIELANSVLPPGVLNSVAGSGALGDLMARHSGINKIVFTGSTEVGKKVMTNAVDTLKRLTLELGGNDAGIILPGTKIEPLLENLFWGCFINGGQTCAALKRLYVHESQYEEVVSKFADFVAKIPVGDGLDPKNLIGPLTNRSQRDLVARFVDDARAKGARVVTGGVAPQGPGYFYPLTVVADATDDMLLVKEEQFGPAIPVIKYKTIDEAIARANSLDVGLGGSVWGNDPAEARKYAVRLECGTAWVNGHGGLHPLACFGGVKNRGSAPSSTSMASRNTRRSRPSTSLAEARDEVAAPRQDLPTSGRCRPQRIAISRSATATNMPATNANSCGTPRACSTMYATMPTMAAVA